MTVKGESVYTGHSNETVTNPHTITNKVVKYVQDAKGKGEEAEGRLDPLPPSLTRIQVLRPPSLIHHKQIR